MRLELAMKCLKELNKDLKAAVKDHDTVALEVISERIIGLYQGIDHEITKAKSKESTGFVEYKRAA